MRLSNKTDDYSESFANFVSKYAGYNRPIRGFCPRYPDLKVEIEETSSSDHYARGLLSEKHRDTKTPQYYFVRFHTELLDPGLLEQLAELGERIKVYKDDLDLGNLSGLRLPEIVHDDANLCVWFIYSLRSLDKSSGELYFRKKLFSGNSGTVYVQVAEDDMVAEAQAETKAKGEAEVKAGLQRGGNKVRRLYCLRLNSCNPIHATISPCPGQRRSAAGRD